MLLLKTTDAWRELNELDERDLLKDHALIQSIHDTCNTDALDDVVSEDFPNGCDIAELAEYFNTEGKRIADELGIPVSYRNLRVELGEEEEKTYEVGDRCLAFGEEEVVVGEVRADKDGNRLYDVKSTRGEDEWVGLEWHELEPLVD